MDFFFEQIIPSDEDWILIESSGDSTCYQTKSWCNYISRIGYTPFYVKVHKCNTLVGYFIGERIWRGVYLITAPFEGIGTYTQGLVCICETSKEERIAIYKDLSSWIFKNRIASFFQVDDWQLKIDYQKWVSESEWRNDFQHKDMICEVRPTLHMSVNKPIDELWANLHYKSCKYSINKARKLGLKVEIVEHIEDIQNFIDVHYDQLKEVCFRKGMKPKSSQKKGRMRALCEELFPDRVLMIKIVGNDEQGEKQVMSSGIFCIDKGECSYWTGASYKRYQKYCPNELMVWEAIQILQKKGAGDLNFCGMADYKLKFGTIYAYVPRLVFTKYAWLYKAKNNAKWLYYKSRKLITHSK